MREWENGSPQSWGPRRAVRRRWRAPHSSSHWWRTARPGLHRRSLHTSLYQSVGMDNNSSPNCCHFQGCTILGKCFITFMPLRNSNLWNGNICFTFSFILSLSMLSRLSLYTYIMFEICLKKNSFLVIFPLCFFFSDHDMPFYFSDFLQNLVIWPKILKNRGHEAQFSWIAQ